MIISNIRNNQVISTTRIINYKIDNSILYQNISELYVLDTFNYQIGDFIVMKERENYINEIGIISGVENNLLIIKSFLSFFDKKIPISSFSTSDGATLLTNILTSYFKSDLIGWNNLLINIRNISNSNIPIVYTLENGYIDSVSVIELIKYFFIGGLNIYVSDLYRNNGNYQIDIIIGNRNQTPAGNAMNILNIDNRLRYVTNTQVYYQNYSFDMFNQLFIMPDNAISMGNLNIGDVWYKDKDDNVSQSLASITQLQKNGVFIKDSDNTLTNQEIAQAVIPSQKYRHEISIIVDVHHLNIQVLNPKNFVIGYLYNLKINGVIYETILTRVVYNSENIGNIELYFGYIESSLKSLI